MRTTVSRLSSTERCPVAQGSQGSKRSRDSSTASNMARASAPVKGRRLTRGPSRASGRSTCRSGGGDGGRGTGRGRGHQRHSLPYSPAPQLLRGDHLGRVRGRPAGDELRGYGPLGAAAGAARPHTRLLRGAAGQRPGRSARAQGRPRPSGARAGEARTGALRAVPLGRGGARLAAPCGRPQRRCPRTSVVLKVQSGLKARPVPAHSRPPHGAPTHTAKMVPVPLRRTERPPAHHVLARMIRPWPSCVGVGFREWKGTRRGR